MSPTGLLTVVNLVTLLVSGLVLAGAAVITGLMARGHARWLGPLGFGILLVEQILLGMLAPALGLSGVVRVISGVVFSVPAAVCLVLAIVLGYRAAVAAGRGMGVRPMSPQDPNPAQFQGQQPPTF